MEDVVGKERVLMAKKEHKTAYQDLANLIRRHGHKVDAYELLAIAANQVGKLIAMQDQRKVTVEMAMQVVMANIETGNLEAQEAIRKSEGRA
jgi:hypothetical protein